MLPVAPNTVIEIVVFSDNSNGLVRVVEMNVAL
jgi:hypothetical protein